MTQVDLTIFGFWADFVNFGGQRRRGDLSWRVMGRWLAEARKGLFAYKHSLQQHTCHTVQSVQCVQQV